MYTVVAVCSLRARAEVEPTDIRTLVERTPLIVLGTVEGVVDDGTDRFAHLHVEDVLKGDVSVGDSVVFLASGSWTCDTTYAEDGEHLLLLLEPLFEPMTTDEDEKRIGIPKGPHDGRVYEVVYSGRGEIHVDENEDGILHAMVFGDLKIPKRLKRFSTNSGDYDVLLPDLLGFVHECVREDARSQTSCQKEEMVAEGSSRPTGVINIFNHPFITRRVRPDGESGPVATCRVYHDEATIAFPAAEDGTRTVFIRKRSPLTRADAVCMDTTANVRRIVLRQRLNLEGLVDHWLFASAPGSTPDLVRLVVFDVDRPDVSEFDVVRRHASTAADLIPMGNPDRDRLSYLKLLDVRCVPSDRECIHRAAVRAGAAETEEVRFNARACNETEPVPLAAYVLVDDLAHPSTSAVTHADITCVNATSP